MCQVVGHRYRLSIDIVLRNGGLRAELREINRKLNVPRLAKRCSFWSRRWSGRDCLTLDTPFSLLHPGGPPMDRCGKRNGFEEALKTENVIHKQLQKYSGLYEFASSNGNVWINLIKKFKEW